MLTATGLRKVDFTELVQSNKQQNNKSGGEYQ